MKKTVFLLAMCAAIGLNAQTTHHINWQIGISQADASPTIDVGDTVMWTFTDGAQHSVTSDTGSTENFDSGVLSAGSTYSHTFTQVGDNPYFCTQHPSMQGIIEVKNLGVIDYELADFSISPNPASNQINISLPESTKQVQVEIYDVLGKLVYGEKISTAVSSIEISNWNSGIYMVKLTDGNSSETKRFVKR